MSVTLKQIRKEVYDLLGQPSEEMWRSVDIDQYINDTIRELVFEGNLLVDSAVGVSIDDVERYDITSSTLWIPDSGGTDSTATVNEGATFSATDTTLTVSDGTVFTVNSPIQIDSEIMLVTAISGNDLTVVRGMGGTTAATHSDGATINIGSALNILHLNRVDLDGYALNIMSADEIADLDVT
jgi:hypothetical protein